MVQRFGLVFTALLALAAGTAPAFAAGRSGLALSADVGAAGGAQMSTSSGTPSLKFGAELGAHLNDGRMFFGLYGDMYSNSFWGGGLTARQFFGASRLFWAQIKLSLLGWAAMGSNTNQVITWTDFMEGGVAGGMRIPMGATMNLQPYVEFDSFTPILTLNSRGPRCNVPMAGMRLALEL